MGPDRSGLPGHHHGDSDEQDLSASILVGSPSIMVCENGFPLFLPGCRESALRASREASWARLMAAAGQATAAKLQTYLG